MKRDQQIIKQYLHAHSERTDNAGWAIEIWQRKKFLISAAENTEQNVRPRSADTCNRTSGLKVAEPGAKFAPPFIKVPNK